MVRPRHPNKEIEAAVRYAESKGWTFVRRGSHAWGILNCPESSREGHQFFIHSTPRNPFVHAEKLRRTVNHCTHQEAK